MQFYFYSNEIFSAWIFRLSYQAKKISEIHQYWPRWISNFYKFVFLKQYVDLFILFCFLAFEIVDCFMASTHQNWHLISTSFFFVLRLVMHLNTCKIFFFYFFFLILRNLFLLIFLSALLRRLTTLFWKIFWILSEV